MGDRIEFIRECLRCHKKMEVCYAPSCGINTVKCECGAEYLVIQSFDLVEKNPTGNALKRAHYGEFFRASISVPKNPLKRARGEAISKKK